ncbi:hypothetical protein Mcup_1089 [Metallosphaera cuprina Ar-4]|uniref:Uncharacterized protein n=1 Tax=Metallosphaera cuprina (strain Ar-4) TaxID=1006006 RepID=F4G2Z6_METCR|nr:hypothetical protein Mcup_1089 [Metallosphaera cuprina Ar-4]
MCRILHGVERLTLYHHYYPMKLLGRILHGVESQKMKKR